MNCLTYLLDLYERGHRFVIYYDSNHCYGVNEYKLFDYGNGFKKELVLGGGRNYTTLESAHKKETVRKIFKLTEKQYKTLEEYYEK